MILRYLPELATATAAFREWYHRKLSTENSIVWGRSRHTEHEPAAHGLSIKVAWGGQELYRIEKRLVAVDDDGFLVVNRGRRYSSFIRASQPIESLAIFFRPGLAEEVWGGMTGGLEPALDRGDREHTAPVEFIESLQLHDRRVTPILRFIRNHVVQGVDDESWYDEQLTFLLERMLAHHGEAVAKADSLPYTRRATRLEAYRRIGLATDYLHANYRQDLGLDELARVACLSKFYFLRLFRSIHGLPPYAFLVRKRAQAALRLLVQSELSTSEVAALVGFSHRSAVFRHVRHWTGVTPREAREQAVLARANRDGRAIVVEPVASLVAH